MSQTRVSVVMATSAPPLNRNEFTYYLTRLASLLLTRALVDSMETTDNSDNFLRAESELILTEVGLSAFDLLANRKIMSLKGPQRKI